MFKNIEMRSVLASELDRIMEHDERIAIVDADLAKANGTISLRKKYPNRAFDVGVAEQNMASVAAGMASYGMIPFISSFTPFATRRICDQIAISICYAKRNVKIIGTDPGVTAEFNGGTHMSFEDIGVLRSIPDIVIFEPVDAIQLKESLPQIIDYEGPVYIRMFRKVAPTVFDKNYKFDLFKGDVIKEGTDVTIFATGIMVDEAIEAEKILRAENIKAEVINLHTIKPIDRELILKSTRKTKAVVTCENHNIIGGLASAVAEVLIEENPVPLRSVGVRDHFGEAGLIPYLLNKYKMTKEHIVEGVKEVIQKK